MESSSIKTSSMFPLFIDLSGRVCLVVGGGKIAEEKVSGLLHTPAEIRVVSPDATPDIAGWAEAQRLTWQRRKFIASDLDGVFLAVVATGDSELNAGIYREAQARGVLCNAVDDPPNCDVYYASVVRRGPLQIAISTSGYSPALSQRLRKEFEKSFGPDYADWVTELGKIREEMMKSGVPDVEERRQRLHQYASQAGFEAFIARQSAARGVQVRVSEAPK